MQIIFALFPKIVGVLFRRLWFVCSEICGFLLFVLPIIKIPELYQG